MFATLLWKPDKTFLYTDAFFYAYLWCFPEIKMGLI